MASLRKQTRDKILQRMALNIDEIMDLSLDDYIAMSKKSTNKHQKITFSESSKETKFGRRKGNIDDEEDDEDELVLQSDNELEIPAEETDTGIWRGPDSSTTYLDCNDTRNDLREKLNNCSKICSPKSAVQYRLMAPNNVASRPRGIPTLLPLDFQMNNRKSNNKGNRRYRNRGNNNSQRALNNFGNSQNNCSVGGVSNGRVQKNRNQEFECKNLRFSVSKNNYYKNNLNTVNSQTGARNMFIETPSSNINLVPSPPLNSRFHLPSHIRTERSCNSGSQQLPVGNLTPQAEAVLNLNTMGNQPGSSNESLKSLLGFQGNVSGEMMPIFASRLMEYIQNGLQNPVVHKPVYDMKIQKDIHEIQQKPLLYKCPGGEVVSSDGAGVNCKIIPRTSGVSLNCRFA